MDSFKVSIILPTYNRAHLIEGCVNSVLSLKYQNWELIIADDNSTDDTFSVGTAMQNKDERIHYYRNPHNLGLPKNRNRAIEFAKGDLIFFIEDDIILQPDCLTYLVDTFRDLMSSDIKVGIIAPALVVENDIDKNNRRSILNLSRSLIKASSKNSPCSIDALTGIVYRNFSTAFDKIQEVDDVHACSLYSRELFNEGFKFAYVYKGNYLGEETEFNFKVKRHGYKLFFQPKAVLYHKTVAIGGCRLSFYKWSYYFFRNHILFIFRNYGIKSVYIIPGFLGFSLYVSLIYLLKRGRV
jgi:glycosyltransferase involved in cell wall biosynthesis